MFVDVLLFKITMLRLVVSAVSEFGHSVLFIGSRCYCVVLCCFLTFSGFCYSTYSS